MEDVNYLIKSLSDNIIDIVTDENIAKQILSLGSEILSTTIPTFKTVLKVSDRIRVLKFKSFLSGINDSCVRNNIDSNQLNEKLIRLSNKKIFNDFIINTYESAVGSKSIKNIAVLGFYLGKNVFLEKNVSIVDIIISTALKELTDSETEIFLSIYGKRKLMPGIDKIEFLNPDEIGTTIENIYSIKLVIEQLKNFRIVGRGVGGFECVEQFGVCTFTPITHEFFNLLQESCVYINSRSF